jgi:hypothetical protein
VDLEPVEEQFIADVVQFIEPLEKATETGEAFADSVENASATVDQLNESTSTASEGVDHLRDAFEEVTPAAEELASAAEEAGTGAEAGAEGLRSMRDAAAETAPANEVLAESYAQLRDKVYEMNPGIDDATASLLAQSAAAELDAAAIGHLKDKQTELAAAEEITAEAAEGSTELIKRLEVALGLASPDTEDLAGRARLLGEELQDAGMAMVVTKDRVSLMENALADTDDQVRKLTTGTSLLDKAIDKVRDDSEDFARAINFVNPALIDSTRLSKDAKSALTDMGFTEQEATRAANALAKAQAALDVALGGSGGGGGIAGKILNMFGGAEGASSLSDALQSVAALGVGMGVLVPLIGALLTGITGLVSGFGAAFIGLVSFIGLAIPGFIKIKDAIHDTHAQLMKLPADERGAVLGVRELESTYKALASAFEPEAIKVFNSAIKVANDLLPMLKPFADAAANAIDNLMTKANKALQPGKQSVIEQIGHKLGEVTKNVPGDFQKWVASITPYIGPAIEAIGEGIAKVGHSLTVLLETLSPKDVAADIRDFFGVIAFMISKTAELIEHVMNGFDDLRAGYKNLVQWGKDAGKGIAGFVDAANRDLHNWAVDTERDFDRVNHDLHNWAVDAEKDYDKAGADIAAFGKDTDRWATDVARDIMDVINWFARIGKDINQWAADGQHDFDDVINAASHLASDVVNFIDHMISSVESAWRNGWSLIINDAKTIPGRILRAVGNLGSLLFNDGLNLIQGLINGVESRVGGLLGYIEHIGSDISSVFGKIMGALSPSRVFYQHGVNIIDGLINGLESRRGALTGTMTSLGTQLAYGTGTTTSTAPRVQVNVPMTLAPGMGSLSSPQFLHSIQGVVQEAVLRYVQLNQGNGLFGYNRRS